MNVPWRHLQHDVQVFVCNTTRCIGSCCCCSLLFAAIVVVVVAPAAVAVLLLPPLLLLPLLPYLHCWCHGFVVTCCRSWSLIAKYTVKDKSLPWTKLFLCYHLCS